MGKASREAGQIAKAKAKQKQKLVRVLILIGVVAFVAIMVVAYNATVRANSMSQNLEIALSEDGSLHVDRSVLSEGFNYVNWGGPEELIIYKNDFGEIVVAFDSCEECYPENHDIHFTRIGSTVTCSNCGMTTPTAHLGEQEWGECLPISVPDAARQDTDSEIIVSGAAFTFATDMFALWDSGDMSVNFASFEA